MLSQSSNPRSKGFLAASLAVSLCASAFGTTASSRGAVIIEDGFSIAGATGSEFSSGNGFAGLPTDTIPGPTGALWQGVAQSNGYNTKEMTSAGMGSYSTGNVGWAAATNGNGGAFTLGTYTSTEIDISVTFGAANGSGSTSYYFGFYSNFSEGGYNGSVDHPNHGTFAGLALDTSGNLSTDNNGTLGNKTAYGPGTFSVNAGNGQANISNLAGATLYTLSYDLNLTDGTLSNVSLTGDSNASGLDGISITGGSAVVTPDYAGFGVNQSNGTIGATSFKVSSPAVPEPAALGLLGLGGLGILLLGKRRRA